MFVVIGLKEIGQALRELSVSAAAWQLLTETNENSQHQLIAFDLSSQVIFMSVSGILCALEYDTGGQKELILQTDFLCHRKQRKL